MPVVAQRTSSKIYTKGQFSLLTKSTLVASICFIAIFFIGFALSYYFKSIISQREKLASTIFNFLIISIVLLSISCILSMIWSIRIWRKPESVGIFFTIINYVTFIGGWGFSFSFLFCYLEQQMLMMVFLVMGLILAATMLLSKLVSLKVEMTLAKITLIGLGLFFVLFLTLIFLWWFYNWQKNYQAIQWIWYLVVGLGALLSIICLLVDFAKIGRMSNFAALTNNSKIERTMSFYYGYTILVDLVMVLYYVVQFFIMIKQN